MRVLAIDPGTTQSAFVVWDGASLGPAEIRPNSYIRDGFRFGFGSLKDWNFPEVVAIEMVACYGMAVGRDVFETCLWIGRFIESSPVEPRLVYRRDVKMHHCGSARAKDANIRQSLIDKYGPPGTKKSPGATYGLKSHLWAAFAIATYVIETAPLQDPPPKAFGLEQQAPTFHPSLYQ